jgi:predicted RNase H-like HicB family nuclease
MEILKFIYYQENNIWVGWLKDYTDYRSQGKTLDELKENLKDIYEDISTGKIPHIRKYGELILHTLKSLSLSQDTAKSRIVWQNIFLSC